MRYFKRIKSYIGIDSFYDEIIQNEEVWKKTEIQNRTPVQLNTRAIFLRTFDKRQKLENKIKNKDNHESDWTSSASYFPGICQFISDFARSVNGILSRALIAQMKPNGIIYRHIDDGCYYLIRDRYHIVVKSVAGTIFYAGNEKVCMQEGELWWFDNKQHHQVENPSDEWRIHIIFDVLPNKYADLAKNPLPLKTLPSWFQEAPADFCEEY